MYYPDINFVPDWPFSTKTQSILFIVLFFCAVTAHLPCWLDWCTTPCHGCKLIILVKFRNIPSAGESTVPHSHFQVWTQARTVTERESERERGREGGPVPPECKRRHRTQITNFLLSIVRAQKHGRIVYRYMHNSDVSAFRLFGLRYEGHSSVHCVGLVEEDWQCSGFSSLLNSVHRTAEKTKDRIGQ